MSEIAANSVVASPAISASHAITNGPYGFDLDVSNYAVVSSDSDLWIKIDFGSVQPISKIRFRGGPDSSGTQTQTLDVSRDGVNWRTLATWSGQTYYSSISNWIIVPGTGARMIRITKTNANYYRLYYMGVELSPQNNLRYRDRINVCRTPNVNTSFLICRRDRFQLFGVSLAFARAAQIHYGTNILTGGTASASSTENGSSPNNAVDNNTSSRWNNNNAMPSWWKYDLGVGVSGTPQALRLYKVSYDQLKNFTLAGSNNDSDWTTLTTGLVPLGLNVWNNYHFDNTTAYRYFRISMADSWSGSWMSIGEIELNLIELY